MILKHYRVAPRRTVKLGAVAAASVIAASLVAGCSSSGSGGGGTNSGGNGGSTAALKTLTVAVPSPNTAWADLYIAQKEGYFKAEGLNVNVLSGPVTSTVAYLQSGQADLVEWSPSTVVPAADKGLDVKVIEANNGDGGLALIGNPKITSIAQVKAKAGCRLGSPPIGTVSYAYALLFVKTLGLTNCKISQVSDVATLNGSTLSGQYDLEVGTYTTALGAQGGGGHILEDPSTPQFGKTFQSGGHFPNVVTFGISDHMAKIKPEIEGFLRAETRAHDALGTQSVGITKLVSDMESVPAIQTENPTLMKADLTFSKPFFALKFGGPTGYVDEATWKLALDNLKNYGFSGYNETAEVNSYAQRVDMSYLKAAGNK